MKRNRDSVDKNIKKVIETFEKFGGSYEGTIHFDNDDVPRYLEHLKKLENRPSSIDITTGAMAFA